MKKAEKRKILTAAAAESVDVKRLLCESSLDSIIDVAAGVTRTLKKGGTIYLAGNGGSAADCQHFATELVVRLTREFERPALASVALTANSSLLTAAGNDYGFEQVFARQVEALIGKKDALVLISTSGNSKNLVEAARAARKSSVPVYALIGCGGGKLKRYATKSIVVPSTSVQRIQEAHIFIIHNLVHMIEQDLF